MIIQYIFIISLVGILLILLQIHKKDLISPSVLFLASAIVCNVMVLIYYNKWELDINIWTYFVYFTGILVFVMSGEISYIFARKTIVLKKKKNNIRSKSDTQLSYNKLFLLFLIVMSIVGAITSYKTLFSVTGAGSLSRAMFLFRNAGASGAISRTFISSQMYRINYATLYVYLYANVYNWRKYKKYDLLAIVYLLTSIIHIWLFTCGRQDIIEIIMFVILSSFIIDYNKKSVNIKKASKMLLLVLAIIPLFYYSSQLVGRNFEAISKMSPLQYFAKYLGGGFVYLDHIIETGYRTEYWGQSSFANIYGKLIASGVLPNSIKNMSAHDFYKLGNTVTIFGRWCEDFGLIGIYVMSFLVGSIFSFIYYKSIKQSESHLQKLIYCRFAAGIVWFGYDDRVCSMLSFPYIVILCFIILFYKILICKDHTKDRVKYRIIKKD